MAPDLIRDSAFGQLVRLATSGRIFPYAEEKDAAILKRYINEEKSRNIRQHGSVHPLGRNNSKEASTANEEGRQQRRKSQESLSERSADTRIDEGDVMRTNAQAEKGQDKSVVDWYGPDDPEVSCRSCLLLCFELNMN